MNDSPAVTTDPFEEARGEFARLSTVLGAPQRPQDQWAIVKIVAPVSSQNHASWAMVNIFAQDRPRT